MKAEEIVARYKTDSEVIAIKRYPNGLYYNHYGYNEQRGFGSCTAGGFESFAEAERMVFRHRPLARKVDNLPGTISFEINNQRKLKLIQRQHDGNTLIVIEEPDGTTEISDDEEAFISPGDFVMLINHYRNCKRENKPIVD